MWKGQHIKGLSCPARPSKSVSKGKRFHWAKIYWFLLLSVPGALLSVLTPCLTKIFLPFPIFPNVFCLCSPLPQLLLVECIQLFRQRLSQRSVKAYATMSFGIIDWGSRVFTNKKRGGINTFVSAVSLYVAIKPKASINDQEPHYP